MGNGRPARSFRWLVTRTFLPDPYIAQIRRSLREQLESLWWVDPQITHRRHCGATPFPAVGGDAIDAVDTIKMHAGAIAQDEAAIAR